MTKREASHAGSWYSARGSELKDQLKQWLYGDTEEPSSNQQEIDENKIRAIIAPHAGLSYSGKTAAKAYRRLSLDASVKRIFLLGPSHHVYLDNCAVSACKEYKTPMGSIQIDRETSDLFRNNYGFHEMQLSVDEDEHSLEMHLPFLYYLLNEKGLLNQVSLVPVLVGSLTARQHQSFGELFARYLNDDTNRFVISSDFCHWGPRFNYFYQPTETPAQESRCIHEGIEQLDRQGMQLIEQINCQGFATYLKDTGNTICGRNPIQVLLNAIDSLKSIGSDSWKVSFVYYDQSSRAKLPTDHSVSYAAAIVFKYS